jgi:CRP-like cAMP-binding protein
MAVWKEDPAAGRSVQVNEMGPGSFFGEMSLLEPVRTSATVTALEPSRLLGLRRRALDVLLTGRAELAAKIWRSFALQFAARLRHATDRLVTPPGAPGR